MLCSYIAKIYKNYKLLYGSARRMAEVITEGSDLDECRAMLRRAPPGWSWHIVISVMKSLLTMR